MLFVLRRWELYAEDFDQHIAVLPEVFTLKSEVTIENIQVGGPKVNLTDGQEIYNTNCYNLRLLIEKKKGLHTAARGEIWGIDVGEARLIALLVRLVAINIEK